MNPNRTVPRNITIRPCLNGYVVQVGCQIVVFNDMEAFISALREYLKNPGIVEASLKVTALHRDLLVNQAPTEMGCDTALPGSERTAIRQADGWQDVRPEESVASATTVTPPPQSNPTCCQQETQRCQGQ